MDFDLCGDDFLWDSVSLLLVDSQWKYSRFHEDY